MTEDQRIAEIVKELTYICQQKIDSLKPASAAVAYGQVAANLLDILATMPKVTK